MSERMRAVLSPVISWIDDGKVSFRRVDGCLPANGGMEARPVEAHRLERAGRR